jgi:hypothetical protein
MNAQEGLKPHDLAAGEINGWRGHCLDVFAKAERAIASTLEVANAQDCSITLRHLAGHRLADLAKLAMSRSATNDKQCKVLLEALDAWLAVESKRAFLAHGVATVLIDRLGSWHVQLDFTKYQGKGLERLRWTCSKEEATQFEEELQAEFKRLSTHLGQFRKNLIP